MTKPEDKPNRPRSSKLPKTAGEFLSKTLATLQVHYGADCAVVGCTIPDGRGTEIVFDPESHTFGNMFAIALFSQHMANQVSADVEIVDDDVDGEGEGEDDAEAEA